MSLNKVITVRMTDKQHKELQAAVIKYARGKKQRCSMNTFCLIHLGLVQPLEPLPEPTQSEDDGWDEEETLQASCVPTPKLGKRYGSDKIHMLRLPGLEGKAICGAEPPRTRMAKDGTWSPAYSENPTCPKCLNILEGQQDGE
jgi:hypothetical protein